MFCVLCRLFRWWRDRKSSAQRSRSERLICVTNLTVTVSISKCTYSTLKDKQLINKQYSFRWSRALPTQIQQLIGFGTEAQIMFFMTCTDNASTPYRRGPALITVSCSSLRYILHSISAEFNDAKRWLLLAYRDSMLGWQTAMVYPSRQQR